MQVYKTNLQMLLLVCCLMLYIFKHDSSVQLIFGVTVSTLQCWFYYYLLNYLFKQHELE